MIPCKCFSFLVVLRGHLLKSWSIPRILGTSPPNGDYPKYGRLTLGSIVYILIWCKGWQAYFYPLTPQGPSKYSQLSMNTATVARES